MKLVFRGGCIVSLALAVMACSLLKKKGDDAGVDAAMEAAVAQGSDADAAPLPATGPAAENEADIARFPDETKLESVAASTRRPYKAREAPVTGKVVALVVANAAVVELAQREKYFLIVFDDAKNPGKKLMGWVHQDAFSAAAPSDAGLKELSCPAGEVALFGDTPFCGKPCTKDADCTSGEACKGSANKWKNGKAGDAVTVCTVFSATHDAGAPHVDAGASHADAGVKVDASAPPATTGDVVGPTAGACPAGFTLLPKDKQCHRNCPNLADCHAGFACIKCDPSRVCVAMSQRDLCK